MSSSFCLLVVKSHDFSQAEKERTARKAKQIHKITAVFTQNGPRLGQAIGPLWGFCSPISIIVEL